MTFADWYAATIAPQIEQSLKPLPKAVHEQIRKSSQEAMAACWNAALDSAIEIENDDLLDNLKGLNRLKVKIS